MSLRPIFLVLAVALLAQTGFAQKAAEKPVPYRGPIYALPSGKRPALEAYPIYFDVDGIQFTRIGLRGSGILMSTQSSQDWAVVPDPATSVTFVNKLRPEGRWSISVYGKTEFLPEVTPEAVKGYVAFLRARYGDDIKILNEDEGFEQFVVGSQPLDSGFLVVSYELKDEKTEIVQRADEYIINAPRFLYIARVYGTPEVYRVIQEEARTLIMDLTADNPARSQTETSGEAASESNFD